MFTRIIDPFNNHTWNKKVQSREFYEYLPKTRPITKNTKKKITSNVSTSCDEEFNYVPEIWIIKTEQNDFSEEICQPKIDDVEVDDFVMV